MDSNIVITRLGHYLVPAGDSEYEHAALVVGVGDNSVNLVCWQQDGESYRRERVPITGHAVANGHASFHLTRDCPKDNLV